MDMTSSMNSSCSQSMLWNWYTIDSCFLTESWHVASNGAFAATCIGTVLLVMVMEALRRLGREYDDWILRGFQARAGSLEPPPVSSSLLNKSFASVKGGGSNTTITNSSSAAAAAGASRTVVFRASPLQQTVRAVIHAVSLGIAYIVMLLVMSYNGYVIICVLIGGGLGKFFCDWMTKQMIVKVGTDIDEEENSAGIEEPSVCCG